MKYLEKELEQKRQNNDKRKTETIEGSRKVEISELKHMFIQNKDKNIIIASAEAELRNANKNLTTALIEDTQLTNQLTQIQKDVNNSSKEMEHTQMECTAERLRLGQDMTTAEKERYSEKK